MAAQILLWFAPILWCVAVLWKTLGTLLWGLGLSWSCLVSVCSDEEQKLITWTFKADSVFFTQALLISGRRLNNKGTLLSHGTYMATSGSVLLPSLRLLLGRIHPMDAPGRIICFLHRLCQSNQCCWLTEENGIRIQSKLVLLQPWKRASDLKRHH